jgi:peptidyl-prolyl cis-trans isomerase C
VASNQIEQYLMTQKNKELAAAELQRLRANARIEYLNKSMTPDGAPGAMPAGASSSSAVAGAVPAATAATTPRLAPADNAGADKGALDRGVAGLK